MGVIADADGDGDRIELIGGVVVKNPGRNHQFWCGIVHHDVVGEVVHRMSIKALGKNLKDAVVSVEHVFVHVDVEHDQPAVGEVDLPAARALSIAQQPSQVARLREPLGQHAGVLVKEPNAMLHHVVAVEPMRGLI